MSDVELMAQELFRGYKIPIIIHTRNDCKIIGEDNTKPLRLLSERYDIPLSDLLIVDDIPINYAETPSQGISIPEYSPPENIAGLLNDDPTLEQIIAWWGTEQALQAKTASQLIRPDLFVHGVDYYRKRAAQSLPLRYESPPIQPKQTDEIFLEHPY